MSEEKPLSDPYTGTSSTPPPAGKLEPPALGGFSFGLPSVPQVEDQYESPPDFLFPENFDTGFRRSWGERLTFHIGAAYLVGEELPWLKPLCPAPDSKRGCSPVHGRLVNGRIVRPCGGAPRLAG